MSKSFRKEERKADEEDAAASDLRDTEELRETATVSMLEEIGNYSLPSSTVTSSSNLEESVLHGGLDLGYDPTMERTVGPQYVEEPEEEEFNRGTEDMHHNLGESERGSFWPTLGNQGGEDTNAHDVAADLGEVLHVEDRGRINYSSIQKGENETRHIEEVESPESFSSGDGMCRFNGYWVPARTTHRQCEMCGAPMGPDQNQPAFKTRCHPCNLQIAKDKFMEEENNRKEEEERQQLAAQDAADRLRDRREAEREYQDQMRSSVQIPQGTRERVCTNCEGPIEEEEGEFVRVCQECNKETEEEREKKEERQARAEVRREVKAKEEAYRRKEEERMRVARERAAWKKRADQMRKKKRDERIRAAEEERIMEEMTPVDQKETREDREKAKLWYEQRGKREKEVDEREKRKEREDQERKSRQGKSSTDRPILLSSDNSDSGTDPEDIRKVAEERALQRGIEASLVESRSHKEEMRGTMEGSMSSVSSSAGHPNSASGLQSSVRGAPRTANRDTGIRKEGDHRVGFAQRVQKRPGSPDTEDDREEEEEALGGGQGNRNLDSCMEQFRQTCREEFTKEENARMSDFEKWQSKVSATMQRQMEEHRMQEEREVDKRARQSKEWNRMAKAKEIQHQTKMRKLDEEIAANQALREREYG